MSRPVKIASFVYPWEAHIAQSRLEADGIRSFVFDEGIVHANPLLSHAVGGVKLLVSPSDAERALSILHEAASEADLTEGFEEIDDDDIGC